MSRAALILSPVVGLLALLLGTVVVFAPDDVAYACTPASEAAGATAELTSEQWRSARTIATQANELRVPERGVVIAIAAALQESGLRNLEYGDRDSLGLLQQRPSMGWGTPSEVMDPEYAAHAFFTGAGPNGGLLDVVDWQRLPLWLAAQSVQRSAYPLAYADHEAESTAIVQTITTNNGAFCLGGDAVCRPVDLPMLAGLTPDAKQVAFCVVQHFGITDLLGVGARPSNADSDHPSGRAVDVMIADYRTEEGRHLGDTVAAWLHDHRAGLGITYVIWDARIWSAARASEGWRPYVHPSGAADDISAHRDHVHVSVVGTATVATQVTRASARASRPGPLRTPAPGN